MNEIYEEIRSGKPLYDCLQDLKRRIVGRALAEYGSNRKTAEFLKVNRPTLLFWLKRWREEGK